MGGERKAVVGMQSDCNAEMAVTVDVFLVAKNLIALSPRDFAFTLGNLPILLSRNGLNGNTLE
ncbi:hypothetical protein ILFOPFJJ_01760 [Ensifer psoraleae]|nr:hypothetical protein [Sinorhizobium psoraleae]